MVIATFLFDFLMDHAIQVQGQGSEPLAKTHIPHHLVFDLLLVSNYDGAAGVRFTAPVLALAHGTI